MGEVSEQIITKVAQLRDIANMVRSESGSAKAAAEELRNLCEEIEQLAAMLDKYEEEENE